MIATETSSSTSETRAERRMPRIVNSVASPPSTIASVICAPTPSNGTPMSSRNWLKYETDPPSEPAAMPQQPMSSVTPAR